MRRHSRPVQKTEGELTVKSTKKPAKRVVKKAPAKKKPAPKPAKARKSPAKKPAPAKIVPARIAPETAALLQRIVKSLDDNKAENIVSINLFDRSSLCDAVVVASGRSTRHVSACAEHLVRHLKETGYGACPADGLAQGDWALVDAGDVIVHIFRPEVRTYYDIEGLWSVGEPKAKRTK
jgi:ribosome-associated protein